MKASSLRHEALRREVVDDVVAGGISRSNTMEPPPEDPVPSERGSPAFPSAQQLVSQVRPGGWHARHERPAEAGHQRPELAGDVKMSFLMSRDVSIVSVRKL